MCICKVAWREEEFLLYSECLLEEMIDKHMSLSKAASTTSTQSSTADEQATEAGDETTVLKASACHNTNLDLSPALPAALPSAAIDISATGSLTVSVEEGLAPLHVADSTLTAASTYTVRSPLAHTALDRNNTHLFTPPTSPTAARNDDDMRLTRLKRDSSIDVYAEAFGLNRPPTPVDTPINAASAPTAATAFGSDNHTLTTAPLTIAPDSNANDNTTGTTVITDTTAQPYLLRTSVGHDSNTHTAITTTTLTTTTTTTTTTTLTITTDTDANNNGNTVSNEEEVDAPLLCQGNTYANDLTQQSTLLTSRITKQATEHDLILLKQEYSRMFIESEYIYCSPFTRAIETAVVALEGHRALRSNGLILNR